MEEEENEEYVIVWEPRELYKKDGEPGDLYYVNDSVGYLHIYSNNEPYAWFEELFPNSFAVSTDTGYELITDVPEEYTEYCESMGIQHGEQTFDDYDKAVEYIKNLEKVKYEKGKFWDDDEEDDEDFDL